MRGYLSAAALFLATILLSGPGAGIAQAQGAGGAPWYEVDALNPGLSDPPAHLDRSTPRSTMESLIFAARRGDWDAAAHLLDLGDQPESGQAAAGAALARQLDTLISRKAVIDWSDLPDRPDALDADAPDSAATAGMARKSILLWTLDLNDRPASIRINRVKPENGEPVWVFSRQSVANIPALYDRYGPSRFEQLLPPVFLADTGLGLMWWELLGLPILIGVAVLGGWITRRLLDAASRRAGRTITKDILRAIRGPAMFGTAAAILSVGTSTFFVFSGEIDTFLGPLIWIGILISSLWLAVNAIDVVLDRLIDFDKDLTERQEAGHRAMATRIAAFRRALVIAAALLGTGLFLSSTNLFQNLGFTLLGTAGAITLILGFAARRILGNIMSSLQIALNQSAQIGDRIVYKDYLCHVERINFTYVQLRDWDGTRLVVPVEEFVSTPFENWTMKEPEMLRIIKIKTSHDADVDALREAFAEIVKGLDQDELGDLDDMKVRVAGHDVFGMDVWFCLPCADPNTSWDIACQAREKIMACGAKMEREGNGTIFPEANPAEAA